MRALTTKERILNEGRELVQRFGYNGFSFQHIADAVGVKKPSLYDHFASKEDLGNALIDQYRRAFLSWTEKVHEKSAKEQLRLLFGWLHEFASRERRICPVAALSADMQTLPPSMRKSLDVMLDAYRKWIASILEHGLNRGEFKFGGTVDEMAEFVLSIVMGGQLVARIRREPDVLTGVILRQLFMALGAAGGGRSQRARFR